MAVELEAAFKEAFLAKKGEQQSGIGPSNTSHEAPGLKSEDLQEPTPPVVKYRKSQRFYHCKVAGNLVFVGLLLEKLLKNKIWGTLSERLEHEDPRNVTNPMLLTTIRANLELGLYASSEMCVADITLALNNARNVMCVPGGEAVPGELNELKLLHDDFQRQLLMGRVNVVSFNYGETRLQVPLTTGLFVQVARDLVDRTMDLPAAEAFLQPVRPIEDGCAGNYLYPYLSANRLRIDVCS